MSPSGATSVSDGTYSQSSKRVVSCSELSILTTLEVGATVTFAVVVSPVPVCPELFGLVTIPVYVVSVVSVSGFALPCDLTVWMIVLTTRNRMRTPARTETILIIFARLAFSSRALRSAAFDRLLLRSRLSRSCLILSSASSRAVSSRNASQSVTLPALSTLLLRLADPFFLPEVRLPVSARSASSRLLLPLPFSDTETFRTLLSGSDDFFFRFFSVCSAPLPRLVFLTVFPELSSLLFPLLSDLARPFFFGLSLPSSLRRLRLRSREVSCAPSSASERSSSSRYLNLISSLIDYFYFS